MHLITQVYDDVSKINLPCLPESQFPYCLTKSPWNKFSCLILYARAGTGQITPMHSLTSYTLQSQEKEDLMTMRTASCSGRMQ